MRDVALLGWGIVLGWFLATWNERGQTTEHRLGEKLLTNARHALWTARIVGSGFSASHTATLNVDGEQLELRLTAPGGTISENTHDGSN